MTAAVCLFMCVLCLNDLTKSEAAGEDSCIHPLCFALFKI